MPRSPRNCPGGLVYHVWNRAAGRLRLFRKDGDYLAFEQVLIEAHRRHPIDILDWCVMPNHWHFVVYPQRGGQVSDFFRWLTHTHAMRSITYRKMIGMGPLYQGRFRSLPVERDDHLLTLLRYVERNALRANLVKRAAAWRWGSAYVRATTGLDVAAVLSDWPIDRPANWERYVDSPQSAEEEEAIRECVRRSRPYGSAAWTDRTAKKLGLGWTIRPRGRPAQSKNI